MADPHREERAMLPHGRQGRQPRRPAESPVPRDAARSVWPGGGEECHSGWSDGERAAHDRGLHTDTGADRPCGGAGAAHRRRAPTLRPRARGRDPDPARHPAGSLRARVGPPEHGGHGPVRLRPHVSSCSWPGRSSIWRRCAQGHLGRARWAPGARRSWWPWSSASGSIRPDWCSTPSWWRCASRRRRSGPCCRSCVTPACCARRWGRRCCRWAPSASSARSWRWPCS